MMDEVPKHRKKRIKKSLSSLSTKHLWDRVYAALATIESEADFIARDCAHQTWGPRNWRWWSVPSWCEDLESECDTLELLIVEIEGRI